MRGTSSGAIAFRDEERETGCEVLDGWWSGVQQAHDTMRTALQDRRDAWGRALFGVAIQSKSLTTTGSGSRQDPASKFDAFRHVTKKARTETEGLL